MAQKTVQQINSFINKNNIETIDLKTIDLAGRIHHISLPIRENLISKLISEGVGFDGSSYRFKKVEQNH